MNEIILITRNELKSILMETLNEFNKVNQFEKVLTINQVAKKTGKSYATIKKYVSLGIIKSTSNGLITNGAVNQWLIGEIVKVKSKNSPFLSSKGFPISQ